MEDATHAIGQLQGYMLQVRHMLFELISLDDTTVSIEDLDDVAILATDGSVVVEQIKSVTSHYNPTTNRSIVFWKTLYNWYNYILNEKLVFDKTSFRMVVMSSHGLETGNIILEFSNALTEETAKNALHAAKISIWGKDDTLKSEIPVSYGRYLDVLFSTDNEEIVVKIIVKFILDVHENDYDDKLLKKFHTQTINTEFADSLFIYMLGWVTDTINGYTKMGLPAVIKSLDYRNALVTQNRLYDQRQSIPALSCGIASNVAREEVESQDVYIQQLDFIELGFDDKLEAASDYLRTKAETIIRADKGLFAPQSLQDYNDRIYRLWKNKHIQTMLSTYDTDIKKGKLLYAQTSEAVLQFKIENSELPCFFGSGTLQALANEPNNLPKIGWHPNYKELINKGR